MIYTSSFTEIMTFQTKDIICGHHVLRSMMRMYTVGVDIIVTLINIKLL